MQLQLGIQVNRDELHVFHMARREIPTSLSSNVLSHRMSRISVVSFMVHQQDQRERVSQVASKGEFQ